MTDETTLLPCPTCGNADPLVEYTQMANDMWLCMMACTNDAPAISFSVQGVGETEEEAYEMACEFWNIRYEPTCHDFGGEEGSNGEGYDFACSACGYLSDITEPNYCPNCGRRVIEE